MTGGWKDSLPRTPEEEAAFIEAVLDLCKQFGLRGIRVAPDCPACGGDLPATLGLQGIGQAEVYPGEMFAFMLCESCGRRANESESIQDAVISRLRLEYAQAESARLRMVKA